MRISYRDGGGQQAAVHPSQTDLFHARPDRSRAPLLLLVVLGVALLAGGGAWWYQSSRVHTYGVVTTGMELFHAPIRSTMMAIHVEPGDRVTADQLLYVLSSEEAAAELEQVRAELDGERQQLASIRERVGIDPDPQRARDLRAATDRGDQARRALAQLEADRRRDELVHAGELTRIDERLALAAGEAELLQRQLTGAKRLLQHGAATPSEVARLESDLAAATHRREELGASRATLRELRTAAQARYQADRDELRSAIEAADAHRLALGADYEAVSQRREIQRTQAVAHTETRIAGLEAKVNHLAQLAGPTEVRALADGVVMEIAVSVGSTVARDGIIMSVAGTGKSWISAFVEAEDAESIDIGRAARIYPTAGGGPLAGRVTAGGGLEYKVHPSLRGRIDSFSAVYTRIDLDDSSHSLIPGNVVEVVLEDD